MQGKSHMINIIVSIAQQSQGFVHMTSTPLGAQEDKNTRLNKSALSTQRFAVVH